MRTTPVYVTAAAILLTITPVVLADTLQLDLNSSFVETIYSPNDNYYGVYDTASMSTKPSYNAGAPSIERDTIFTNVSIMVPAGSVINSATLKLIPISMKIPGSGVLYSEYAMLTPDPNAPSIAPTFDNGSSDFFVESDSFSLVPIIDGDEISTGDLNLTFYVGGQIYGDVATAGVNWNGYIGGYGQVDIPYTIQLDVDYTPTPEPSTFTLLGPGILGLVGVAKRKLIQR
jgi:hypothetical protein